MTKENQKIIVIEREVLFGNDLFEGFKQYHEVDYESRILRNLKIMKRGDVENNPNYKQPIGYTIVINSNLGKVFAYQRSSKDKEYSEKRLQGKWSLGFGGHIEPLDSKDGNSIRESILREVTQEELEIFGYTEYPAVLGYINDDSDSVGKVHFGILYLINTNATKVEPKDSEIAEIRLKTINELEKICVSPDYDIEN